MPNDESEEELDELCRLAGEVPSLHHAAVTTLLRTQIKFEQRSRSRTEIRPIPTALMDNYIKEMQ